MGKQVTKATTNVWTRNLLTGYFQVLKLGNCLVLLSECRKDVVFLLDSSSFLTSEQFDTNLMFVSSVVDRLFNVGGEFAVVSYNNNSVIHINFGQQSATKSQLINSVSIKFEKLCEGFLKIKWDFSTCIRIFVVYDLFLYFSFFPWKYILPISY